MMADLKKARTQGGLFNIDDFIDGVGYIACAGEIALKDLPPLTPPQTALRSRRQCG
jgi:hypothetical protein